MDNERKKKLLETMKQFNKKQKEEVLFFGDEIENQEIISTGIQSIDNYLGGGVKRGTHTIFWGDFSCFIAGTKVLMSDYIWKNIEDIKIGDYVLGFPEKGFKMLKPVKVLNTFTRETNNLVLVKTDKSEVITTPEHPFLAISGLLAKNHTHNRWIKAGQLREYNTKMTFFPNIKRDLEWKKGWLLGFIMTDGSLTMPKSHGGKRLMVHCYNKNPLIRDLIIQFIKEIYSFECTYLTKKTGVFQITIGNSYFPQLIKNQKNQLYNNFLFFSEQFLRGFIAGYCDGDGTHNKKIKECFRFHSTKKEQLDLCKKVLEYFGIGSKLRLNNRKCYKRIRDKLYYCKDIYALEIHSPLRFYLEFQQILKGECYYNLTKQLPTQIVQWKSNRKFNKNFKVYNLETESNTYVANGFPVHNCGKTSLTLQIIANAQKEGKICAYINLEKPVDNERFISLGVNLEELIRADCTKNAEQALNIIKTLCKEKIVDLIVIDSIQALSPKAENENKGKERELDEKTMAELARTMSEFCRRVNPDIYKAKAGIIWIGQLRTNIGSFYSGAILSGGNAIKFYAYQIIFMRRGQSNDAPCKKFKQYYLDPDSKLRYETVNEAIGHDCVFKMDKTNASKSVKEKTEQHFAFIGDKGFVDSYNPNEDIEVRIDPELPEPEQEKVKEMLIEKEILKNSCEKIAQKYETSDLDQTLEEDYSEVENKISEEALKPKKKRGRPKKGDK